MHHTGPVRVVQITAGAHQKAAVLLAERRGADQLGRHAGSVTRLVTDAETAMINRARARAAGRSDRSGDSDARRELASSGASRVRRQSLTQPEHAVQVAAEDLVLFVRRQKVAVPTDVIDALSVDTEPLDVWHVRAPDELRGAERVARVLDEGLRLGIGILPEAAPRYREHHLEPQI